MVLWEEDFEVTTDEVHKAAKKIKAFGKGREIMAKVGAPLDWPTLVWIKRVALEEALVAWTENISNPTERTAVRFREAMKYVLEDWYTRIHSCLTFHVTQMLSGH